MVSLLADEVPQAVSSSLIASSGSYSEYRLPQVQFQATDLLGGLRVLLSLGLSG